MGSLKPETCTNSSLLALGYHEFMHVCLCGVSKVMLIVILLCYKVLALIRKHISKIYAFNEKRIVILMQISGEISQIK